MLKRIFPLLIFAVILFSCSPSKKNSLAGSKAYSASIPKPGDDGLSFATAIVIMETSETEGVKAEYRWIKGNYSSYEIKQQSLSMHDNKPYDVITITQSNGEDLPLYFDVSNFFGKF